MKNSEKAAILANITTRSSSGLHFHTLYKDSELDELESEGLIAINRPVHEDTGIPYGIYSHTVEVTEEGLELVESVDEREHLSDFIDGFSAATGLDRAEAEEQWSAFSRQLDDSDRHEYEQKGMDAGIEQGREFLKLYPDCGNKG